MGIRPAGPSTRESIETAISHLKRAGSALREANCPKSLAKVLSALASTQGALRHADHRITRGAA